MAMLSVLGVELPIAIQSLRVVPEYIGLEPTRNANGILVADRRKVRHAFSFDLAPKTLEEAELYRALIEARGDWWPFAADAYSRKGSAATGTGAWASGGFTCDAAETMILAVPADNQEAAFTWGYAGRLGGTVLGWRTGGTTRVFGWSWRGLESAATVKRERLLSGTFGAAQAYTGAETIAYSPTSQTLTVTESGGTFQFRRLLWIPRYFAQAQVDALLTGFVLDYPTDPGDLPDPPRVLVRTDLFPVGQLAASGAVSNRVVLGEVGELQAVPVMRAGVFDKSTLTMSVRLTEV